MKRKLPILVLAGVLSFASLSALAACGGETTTTDTTTGTDTNTDSTTSSGEKVVTRFETKALEGTLLVGESIDLAEKITVHYADGTTGHEFTIQEGDGYTIEGTTVTFNKIGSYQLLVRAGSNNKQLRYAVKVETQERRDFNEWFDAIGSDYTALNVGIQNGEMVIGGFALHKTDSYFAMYFGDELNMATAKLSDGNFYNGSISNVKSLDEYDLTFNPGVVNWGSTYGAQELNAYMSSSEFTSTVNDKGEVETTAGATTAETFINFTAALTYGGMAQGISLLDFSKEEGAALFGIDLVLSTGERATDLWMIQNVGTTSSKAIEDYQKTGELPARIETEKIDNQFSEFRAAKNYTLEITSTLLDSTGKPSTAENVEANPAKAALVWNQKTLVTEDSVSVMIEDAAVTGYLTHNEALYAFGSDEEGNPLTVKQDGTLWTSDKAAALLAPKESVGNLSFNAYSNEEGVEYFASEAGSITYEYGTTNVVESNAAFGYELFSQIVVMGPMFQGENSIADSFFKSSVLVNKDQTNNYTLSNACDLSWTLDATNDTLSVTLLHPLSILGLNSTGVAYQAITFTYSAMGKTVAPDLSAFIATITE